MTNDLKIVSRAIDVGACVQWVMTPEAGGINVFVGAVRDCTKGRKVLRLEFEAYEPMALLEMDKIVAESFRQWPLIRVLIHHRIGVLQVGDVPVVIAVSAAHRDAAFSACRYIIDTLKKTVPIWKKEVFENGEIWVGSTP